MATMSAETRPGRLRSRLTILTVALVVAAGLASVTSGVSGAAPSAQPGQGVLVGETTSGIQDAISPEQQAPTLGAVRDEPSAAAAASSPQPYPFFPQGGIPWQDLYTFNFVDLDPTSGIQDFDCTQYTYDGHKGHDSAIRTFREQAIGVPVFA